MNRSLKHNPKFRLEPWDYTTPWWYFITIITENHTEYFGKIKDSKLIESKLGMIARESLLGIENHFVFCKIDEFVIMPNHVHLILVIEDTNNSVTPCHGKVQQNNESVKRKFGKPIASSVSTIINHYKGSVTRWANKNNYENFKWQPKFFDRIIRNEYELLNIRNYIQQNPTKWNINKSIDFKT